MDEKLINKLKEVDCSKVKRFSFEGIKTYAKVAKVYDPDTITIVFEYFGQMLKLSMRLNGIDAPELKSKIKDESDACKKGIKLMNDLLLDKIVFVELDKYDKYGRILGIVNTIEPIKDGLVCVNEYLLKYNYVRVYGGEKKLEWTQQELDNVGKST